MNSSIYQQVGACHVTAQTAGQPDGGVGDLMGRAEASKGYLEALLLRPLGALPGIRLPGATWKDDGAGRDGVYTDALGPKVMGKFLDVLQLGRLEGPVRRGRGAEELATQEARLHDDGRIRRLQQAGQGAVDEADDTHDVDAKRGTPAVGVALEDER